MSSGAVLISAPRATPTTIFYSTEVPISSNAFNEKRACNGLEGAVDVPFTRFPGSLHGSEQFTFRNLRHCRIQIMDICAGVRIASSENCYFLVGPCAGPVTISDCTDCVVIVAGKEIQFDRCRQLKVFLHCAEAPVFTQCHSLVLAPWHVAYPRLASQCFAADLAIENKWNAALSSGFTVLTSVPRLDLPVTDVAGNSLGPCEPLPDVAQAQSDPTAETDFVEHPWFSWPLPPSPTASCASDISHASIEDIISTGPFAGSPGRIKDLTYVQVCATESAVSSEPDEKQPDCLASPRVAELQHLPSPVARSESLESPQSTTPSPTLYLPGVAFSPIAFVEGECRPTQVWSPVRSPRLVTTITGPSAFHAFEECALECNPNVKPHSGIIGTLSCPRRRPVPEEHQGLAPVVGVVPFQQVPATVLSSPVNVDQEVANALHAANLPDTACASNSENRLSALSDFSGYSNIPTPHLVGTRGRALRPRLPQPNHKCPDLPAWPTRTVSEGDLARLTVPCNLFTDPEPVVSNVQQPKTQEAQPRNEEPPPRRSNTPGRARVPPPTHAASSLPSLSNTVTAAPTQPTTSQPQPVIVKEPQRPRSATPGRVVHDIFNNELVVEHLDVAKADVPKSVQSPPHPTKPVVNPSDAVQDFVTLHLMLEQLLKLLDARKFEEAKQFHRIVDECHLLVAPEADKGRGIGAPVDPRTFIRLPADERLTIVREQTRLTSECISSFFLLLEEMDAACSPSPADAASYVNSLVEFAYEVRKSILVPNAALLREAVRAPLALAVS
eukprot:TRINITY_DN4904_c2_g1_i1.p1 TRINITY_DN4904_c2_g1~~TRINITY_DN4904_c2_g1_i1.p1  ORF type:complete len:784 (+),score=77.20 TRINITY_DN4904_c2_g1_i1:54-2405(+)